MYDKEHVKLVQMFAGMINDHIREAARNHDSDKKDPKVTSKMHKQISDHHRLLTNPHELDIVSLAEMIADNAAGAAEYGWNNIKIPAHSEVRENKLIQDIIINSLSLLQDDREGVLGVQFIEEEV